jgi:hypothetical protein
MARAFLKRIPWQVWCGIAVVAGLFILWNVAGNAGEARVEAEQADTARKATERAREADNAAGKATDDTRNDVEQTNDQARDAADGSDDPLRDGLNSLRRNTASSGLAACPSSRVRGGTACA